MKTLANLKLIGVCIPMIFFLGLAACEKKDNTAESTGEKMDQATDKAAVVIDDAGITTKVKAAILAEPGLDSLQISVDTVNGVATLSGTVDSQANSDKAAGVASGVSDVKGVENKLVVKSAS
jgi:hyperosmotically inducible protein